MHWLTIIHFLKQEPCEKLIEMSRNGDYTTGNVLDFSNHHNYYKLIDVDLYKYKYSSKS